MDTDHWFPTYSTCFFVRPDALKNKRQTREHKMQIHVSDIFFFFWRRIYRCETLCRLELRCRMAPHLTSPKSSDELLAADLDVTPQKTQEEVRNRKLVKAAPAGTSRLSHSGGICRPASGPRPCPSPRSWCRWRIPPTECPPSCSPPVRSSPPS